VNKVNILVIITSYENNTVYDLIKLIFGKYITKDLTVRNQKMVLTTGDVEFLVQFFSSQASINSIRGVRPDILIIHGKLPEDIAEYVRHLTYGCCTITI